MLKIELYSQIFASFKELCASGNQTCSLSSYCEQYDVDRSRMDDWLHENNLKVSELPGFSRIHSRRNPSVMEECLQAYNDFKELCASGQQVSSFFRFYRGRNLTKDQMRRCMIKYKLVGVTELPGYVYFMQRDSQSAQEVPFENVIFEEAGFLPAEDVRAIKVMVDARIAVVFPADTDVDVVARFIKKMGEECGHVGA